MVSVSNVTEHFAYMYAIPNDFLRELNVPQYFQRHECKKLQIQIYN